MLERLKDLPAGIDGIRANRTLCAEDYERVMVPILEEARREGRRVRLLYQLAPEFSGFTPGAAWEDARVGLRYLRLFDGCAIVGDIAWIRDASRLAGLFMPCPVRTFPNSERANAVAWLDSLTHGARLSFRLLPESGVLVIEVTSALRREDFDALSAVVDGWIEAHGALRGVVVHAPEFPGWQNLGGFMSHLRFVRDHHRKVRRVAIVVGGELAEIVPRLLEHFVQAEVKHFDYAAFDEAIAWAGGPTAH